MGSSALWAPGRKCTLSQEMAALSALGAQVGDRVPPPRLAGWPTNPGHLPPRPGQLQDESGGAQPAAGIHLGWRGAGCEPEPQGLSMGLVCS